MLVDAISNHHLQCPAVTYFEPPSESDNHLCIINRGTRSKGKRPRSQARASGMPDDQVRIRISNAHSLLADMMMPSGSDSHGNRRYAKVQVNNLPVSPFTVSHQCIEIDAQSFCRSLTQLLGFLMHHRIVGITTFERCVAVK